MSKIKAICLDREYHKHMLSSGSSADVEVEPIHKVIKASFTECDYQHVGNKEDVLLFERCFQPVRSIRKDLWWTYFWIGDQLYNSFYTNKLSYWKEEVRDFKEPDRQLSIFDF